MDEIIGLKPDLLVSEILERWPATIAVFLNHRMACVGCGMSGFETLSSAAQIYQVQVSVLVREMQSVIDAGTVAGDLQSEG